MPRATIAQESARHDLKTLEGGFVELKRMPYSKWLERQEMALHIQIEQQRGQAGMKGDVQMKGLLVAQMEFRECIVNHNLEDDAGNLLDFRSPMALVQLDPRIGDEIGALINGMHEFDPEGK